VFGGGGLGRYIVQGFARRDDARLWAGALMVALLAIAVELGFSWWIRRAQRWSTPQRQDVAPPAEAPAG
jgi:ABC-type proline/glycine betaine transport system permease subunit